MATITYRSSDVGEGGAIHWHGQAFEPNKAVQSDDAALIQAARSNPFFEVVGGDDAKDSVDRDRDRQPVRPVEAGKTGDMRLPGDNPDPVEPDEDEAFGAYTVKHKGRGKYAVLKGDDTVADGLTKEEAERHATDLKSADEAARA